MHLFLLYQYIITGLVIAFFINFLINNFVFRKISNYTLPEDFKNTPPLVSILIPARNEELNIKRCIKSLLKQDYGNIEILVLDDGSVDNTSIIVKNLEKIDKRVKLFTGKPLKKGWLGKSYACWQLSKYAKGEYLVFTDADTIHLENSISNLMGALIRNKLDSLSAIPRQIMVSFHERMVVTWVHFGIMILLPLLLTKKSKNPLFANANGQCLLFKSEVYEKIGGHKSIKNKILEDIHISKQVRRCGYSIMVFDASRTIHCRMYREFNKLISGFSKFMFAAFDYQIVNITVVVFLISALFLFPFFLLPMGLFIFNWSYATTNLLIIQVFLILVMRIIMAIRLRGRVTDSLLHPISMMYVILLCINSIIQAKSSVGVPWKERNYDVSKRNYLDSIGDNERQKVYR